MLVPEPEPFSLDFTKPHSLPPALLGFHRRVVCHDVDGSVGDGGAATAPPYEAPRPYDLDHPDYVLITFSEGAGAGFEHAAAGEQRQVFCKLSLYPLFREERMLPRDTQLLGGERAEFTLGFWNPDGRTPYRFHGVDFSFSLSFVSPGPGE